MMRHEHEPVAVYAGRRVVILGMARQGTALARYLLAHGAQLTLSDLRTEPQLAPACDALRQFAVERGVPAPSFVLGGHPFELLDGADLLCLSGGVSPAVPIVQEALRRGIALSNDGALTLRHCRAPIVGITGSAGKTTTTTLTSLMLTHSGYTVHVGGNIGTPFIDRLDEIRPGDKVVMELSSFQLELFDRSPAIAAVLNITPNHLDRHGTMAAYVTAKEQILVHQGPDDLAVLNWDDPTTRQMGLAARHRVLWFSVQEPVAQGAWLRGDELVLHQEGVDDVVCRVREMRLRGTHNVANVLAACVLASAAGAPIEAVRRESTSFAGVEHRLELVSSRAGVRWYNDSIATSPERAMAALRSFEEPIILLAGGRDKHLPWEEMAALIWRWVRHLVLFGEAAGLIEANVERARPSSPEVRLEGLHHAGDLESAVRLAAALAQPGDVVLLSPGGTSFDAYADFVARGEHFRQLVVGLE